MIIIKLLIIAILTTILGVDKLINKNALIFILLVLIYDEYKDWRKIKNDTKV